MLFRSCVGLDDGNVFLWDMDSRRVVTGPLCHPGGPCLVSVSSDGKTLIAGTGEGCLKVWDTDELLSSTGSQTVPRLGLQSDVMWSPFREGWLVGPNSEWLLWVPEEFRDAIRAHTPKHEFGRKGRHIIDFSRFVHGERWATCYLGATGEAKVVISRD